MRTTILLVLVSLSAGEECVTTKASDPGSEAMVPCVFPFTYKGVTYSSCTAVDEADGLDWCSTKVDSAGVHVPGEGGWAHCAPHCPRQPGCPRGWTLLQSGCYRLLRTETGLDKDTAVRECRARGGYLADITSREEMEHVTDWYSNSLQPDKMFTADALWLSIHNDTEKDAWISDRTGQPLSFDNWLDTEPNSQNDNEKCAAIFADKNFNYDFGLKPFGWFDQSCTSQGFDFWKKWRINMAAVCERDVLETLEKSKTEEPEKERVVGADGCYENWSKAGAGCYLFQRLPSTYREAREFCRDQGGYLAEIQDQQEFNAVEEAWRDTRPNDDEDKRSYWIGLTDLEKEGRWVTDRSGEEQEFTAWSGGEPNNYGDKTPGEDCTIAHLWTDNFKWYDAPCDVRGFGLNLGSGVTLNPLCEHDPGTTTQEEARLEGTDQEWVRINEDEFKFIEISYGVSKAEAEEICEGNGGILAEIKDEETRVALKEYYKKNVLKDTTNFFLAALNLFRSSPEEVKYAWWIGASDEEEEGHWKWGDKKNVTYSSWYFWGGDKQTFNPDGTDNPTVLSFGDFDCAAIVDLDIVEDDDDDDEEKREKYEERVEAEDTFKWVTASCYSRTYYPDGFNLRLTPLCQKV